MSGTLLRPPPLQPWMHPCMTSPCQEGSSQEQEPGRTQVLPQGSHSALQHGLLPPPPTPWAILSHSWPGEPFLAGGRPEVQWLCDRVRAPHPSSPPLPLHPLPWAESSSLLAKSLLGRGDSTAFSFCPTPAPVSASLFKISHFICCGFLVLFFYNITLKYDSS